MSMQQDQESILMAHLGHIFGAGSLAIRQKVTFPISFADTDHARKEKNSKNLISQAAAAVVKPHPIKHVAAFSLSISFYRDIILMFSSPSLSHEKTDKSLYRFLSLSSSFQLSADSIQCKGRK